jgi:hypothetical protein
VVQQCASAGVDSALLDSFEELGILFEHAICGLLNKSRSILVPARVAMSRRRASLSAEHCTSIRLFLSDTGDYRRTDAALAGVIGMHTHPGSRSS